MSQPHYVERPNPEDLENQYTLPGAVNLQPLHFNTQELPQRQSRLERLSSTFNLSRQWIQTFSPFLIAILLLLVIEASLRVPLLEAKLNLTAANPLPRKLEELSQPTSTPYTTLTFGSSRMMNGFASPIFDMNLGPNEKTYNLGVPEGGYDIAMVLFQSYLKDHPAPSRIILEVGDFTVNPDYYSDGLYYSTWLNEQAKEGHLPEAIWELSQATFLTPKNKADILLCWISSISRYRKVMSPEVLLKIALGKQTTQPINNDFIQGWQPMVHRQEFKHFTTSWIQPNRYLPVKTQGLETFIQMAQRHGTEVVLVTFPDHPEYEAVAKASPLTAHYEEAINQLAQAYGVRLIDFAKQPYLGDPKVIFEDARHLNPVGAELYTRALSVQLHVIQSARLNLPPEPYINHHPASFAI